MRSNLMCVLMCAAAAAGWWWITRNLFVAVTGLSVGLWFSLREPEEERKLPLLVADAVVPGFFGALLNSVFFRNR